jgi:lipopolysaccharide/colanic/teichoic acid biosynthesis glycosyltransferase
MRRQAHLFPSLSDVAETGAARKAAAPLPDLSHLHTRRAWRAYLRTAAVLADALAITLAFMIASFIRFGTLHEQALMNLGAVMPVYIAIVLGQRGYNISAVVNARVGSGNAISSFLITLSAVGLTIFFLKVGTEFSRATFGLGSTIALILIPGARYGVGALSRCVLGEAPLNVVMIRDGADLPATPDMVALDARRDNLEPRLDDPTLLDRLGRALEAADRVLVACPPERRQRWATILKGADVSAEVLAPELDSLGSLGIGQYEGRSTLVVAVAPLGILDRFMKRTLDLVLTIGVMPLALPLMGLVAITIRLDTRGPILFAQERVGLGNRLFRMYKFRSMHVDRLDADGAQSTSRTDDRITRVGRIIRATSLDELPQLFNVLSGVMSIVGPRPHALGSRAGDHLFWDIDPSYWHRHAVKPGLTGLAQVRGYRGATDKREDLTNRLDADLEYLSGWTIWRDIRIIAATFRVLVHRNAF